MELIALCLIIVLFVIIFIPIQEENNSNNYRLTHCEIHKWINMPTGYKKEEGFEENYTICEKCGFRAGENQE